MTAPISPIPIGQTAGYITPGVIAAYQNFDALPEYLQALDTVIIYIDPNGNVFHLNGPLAGREGVRLGQNIKGERHLPFEQVVTESAFQFGATIERTNYIRRNFNLRLMIGGTGFNNYTYRLCEDRWWAGQVETAPGWFGVFTRMTGWRWSAVWPLKTIDTAQKYDPVMYGNNYAVYDVDWVAPLPCFFKPAIYQTWDTSGLVRDANGFFSGNVTLANRGDLPTYVNYIVNGSGLCQVQDNNSSTMVALPEIFASDGSVLVDTDPTHRTLVADNDPVDNLFYKLVRASGILSFFLGVTASAGEAIWLRSYIRFVYTVPPQTVVHFKVANNNPKATITVIVPQRYKRAW